MREFECQACYGNAPAIHRIEHGAECPGQIFVQYVVLLPEFDRALARDEAAWL